MLIERIEDACGTVIEVNVDDNRLLMMCKDDKGEAWLEFDFDDTTDIEWLQNKLAVISSNLSHKKLV